MTGIKQYLKRKANGYGIIVDDIVSFDECSLVSPIMGIPVKIRASTINQYELMLEDGLPGTIVASCDRDITITRDYESVCLGPNKRLLITCCPNVYWTSGKRASLEQRDIRVACMEGKNYLVHMNDLKSSCINHERNSYVILNGKKYSCYRRSYNKKYASEKSEVIAMAFSCLYSFQDCAVKAFKKGIIEVTQKTLDLMESEVVDKDIVELSKECISLLQKIFDTMASMGAANAPKNEVNRALNECFQQFDDKEEQKKIQKELNRIAQNELRQHIKARSELLDMFNA